MLGGRKIPGTLQVEKKVYTETFDLSGYEISGSVIIPNGTEFKKGFSAKGTTVNGSFECKGAKVSGTFDVSKMRVITGNVSLNSTLIDGRFIGTGMKILAGNFEAPGMRVNGDFDVGGVGLAGKFDAKGMSIRGNFLGLRMIVGKKFEGNGMSIGGDLNLGNGTTIGADGFDAGKSVIGGDFVAPAQINGYFFGVGIVFGSTRLKDAEIKTVAAQGGYILCAGGYLPPKNPDSISRNLLQRMGNAYINIFKPLREQGSIRVPTQGTEMLMFKEAKACVSFLDQKSQTDEVAEAIVSKIKTDKENLKVLEFLRRA